MLPVDGSIQPPSLTTLPPTSETTRNPTLPMDLIKYLFRLMDGTTLMNCRLSCKTWKKIIDEELIDLPRLMTLQSSIPSAPVSMEYFDTPNAIREMLITPEEVFAFKQPLTSISRIDNIPTEYPDAIGLDYIAHSQNKILLRSHQESPFLTIYDRQARTFTKLDISQIPASMGVASEEKYAVLAALFTSSHQIVTVSRRGTVCVWNPDTLQCLHAQVIKGYPAANTNFWGDHSVMLGSILVIGGAARNEGRAMTYRFYSVNIANSTQTTFFEVTLNTLLWDWNIGWFRYSETHVFIFDVTKNEIHAFCLNCYGDALNKAWTIDAHQNGKLTGLLEATKLVGANRHCLIYRVELKPNIVVSADTGKTVAILDVPDFTKWIVKKQLAIANYSRGQDYCEYIDVYATPLGKKVASLNIQQAIKATKGSENSVIDIKTIDFENNELSLFYQNLSTHTILDSLVWKLSDPKP